jgi:uncharacterized membrane protein
MSHRLLQVAFIPLGAAIVLASCVRGGASETPPPARPELPPSKIDLSGTIAASGTEPAWSLTINGTTLTLRRPGDVDLVGTAPGAVMSLGQAHWNAVTADGHTFTATIYSSYCTDAQGRQLPFTAEIDVVTTVLSGCASMGKAPVGPAAATAAES